MSFVSLQMQFNHSIIDIERWYKNRLLTKIATAWHASQVALLVFFPFLWSKIDPVKWMKYIAKQQPSDTMLLWISRLHRCRHNEYEQTSKCIPKPLQISWNLYALYTNNKWDGDLSWIWSATCNTIQNTRIHSQPNVWEYRFLGDIGILSHEHLTANNALSYNYINVKRASQNVCNIPKYYWSPEQTACSLHRVHKYIRHTFKASLIDESNEQNACSLKQPSTVHTSVVEHVMLKLYIK